MVWCILWSTGPTLSLAAASKGGGAYYVVSRSLGVEIGGSIGIPLCLSRVLSIALYTIGFTESGGAASKAMPLSWP